MWIRWLQYVWKKPCSETPPRVDRASHGYGHPLGWRPKWCRASSSRCQIAMAAMARKMDGLYMFIPITHWGWLTYDYPSNSHSRCCSSWFSQALWQISRALADCNTERFDVAVPKTCQIRHEHGLLGKLFKASVGFQAVSDSHLVGPNKVQSRQNESCSGLCKEQKQKWFHAVSAVWYSCKCVANALHWWTSPTMEWTCFSSSNEKETISM